MAVTAPPTITALPNPPDPNNRATFNTLAYPWSVAQQTLATEVGAVADNVYDNAIEAQTFATTATTQAGIATTAASTATTQAGLATTAANNAAASFDSFDDRYLGAKSSDPSVDNDGGALITGALYFNSVAGEMRAWNGSAWSAAYLPASGYATLNGTETLTNKTINFSNNTLTGVQATLVSGTNIKTIGGTSVLGSGDIDIAGVPNFLLMNAGII